MTDFGLIFLLLVIYQLKHFLADYPLQGRYMLGKFKDGTEWIKPLLAHVGVHAGFTFVIANAVFLTQGIDNLGLAIEIALFDAAVHFVMDRLKAGRQYLGRFKPLTAGEYIHNQNLLEGDEYDPGLLEGQDATMKSWLSMTPGIRKNARDRLRSNTFFWWALGFDQMVHHLTHYACIYFILRTIRVLP